MVIFYFKPKSKLEYISSTNEGASLVSNSYTGYLQHDQEKIKELLLLTTLMQELIIWSFGSTSSSLKRQARYLYTVGIIFEMRLPMLLYSPNIHITIARAAGAHIESKFRTRLTITYKTLMSFMIP